VCRLPDGLPVSRGAVIIGGGELLGGVVMLDRIRDHLRSHTDVVQTLVQQAPVIEQAAQRCGAALAAGNKVLLCGNGGSAADAQHIAAELIGRFINDRRSLPAVALTTDTSALTAIANDYGYEYVFSRQVEGLAKPGDVLIAISTSGNSPNINHAAARARQHQCEVIGLIGKSGGALAPLCDTAIVIGSDITARIQECHILIGHILCDLIEQALPESSVTT